MSDRRGRKRRKSRSRGRKGGLGTALLLLLASGLFLGFAVSVTGVRDGRDYLHRGLRTETLYMVVGHRYDVSLSCRNAPRKRANTLRADDSEEALAFLAQRFPDCEVTWMKRI
ncbi:MAG: hypothetical protein QNJ30_03265 [Kiloniellales bacterium]|nr:hypothetical protein [Kiloniellales bacterium]